MKSCAVGGFCLLASILLVGYHMGMWLLHARWPEDPFWKLFLVFGEYEQPRLHTSWLGVQAIWDWIMVQPAAGVLAVAGLAIAGLGSYIEEKILERFGRDPWRDQ